MTLKKMCIWKSGLKRIAQKGQFTQESPASTIKPLFQKRCVEDIAGEEFWNVSLGQSSVSHCKPEILI